MKHATAILASIVITGLLGLGIIILGANALTNKNTVPVQNSPTSISGVTQPIDTSQSLQSQIAQYQAQVNSLQTQLDQANQMLAQYQSLIDSLQQAGVIRIQSDGSISIPRSFFGNR